MEGDCIPQYRGKPWKNYIPPSEELVGWQELVEGLSRSSRGDTLLQGDNPITDEQRVWEIQGSPRNRVSAVRDQGTWGNGTGREVPGSMR